MVPIVINNDLNVVAVILNTELFDIRKYFIRDKRIWDNKCVYFWSIRDMCYEEGYVKRR